MIILRVSSELLNIFSTFYYLDFLDYLEFCYDNRINWCLRLEAIKKMVTSLERKFLCIPQVSFLKRICRVCPKDRQYILILDISWSFPLHTYLSIKNHLK